MTEAYTIQVKSAGHKTGDDDLQIIYEDPSKKLEPNLQPVSTRTDSNAYLTQYSRLSGKIRWF